MNINNNKNSLTSWEKSTELNFKIFALINSSLLSQYVAAHAITSSPVWASSDHTLVIQVLPRQMQLFHMKCHSPWDKVIEKVVADFQKDLLFLRHCSWGFWNWIWRISRLPGNTFHQHKLLAGLVSVLSIFQGFYQLHLINISLLLVVLCHELCPEGCLLLCWFCWLQSL